jgi:hypothetical protein
MSVKVISIDSQAEPIIFRDADSGDYKEDVLSIYSGNLIIAQMPADKTTMWLINESNVSGVGKKDS